MTRAVLSLGSNLGDRAAHLREAVAALGDVVMAVSGVYETPPWGGPGPDGRESPPYLNAVVLAVDDDDDPYAWLTRARQLEQTAGRARDPGWQYAPRTLDVDVITVWTAEGASVVSDDPDLVLPHPRAHQRAFVLRPWLDIQPYAQLPGHGWVYDLVRADPVAADLPTLRPCAELSLEP
ncbi:2-amino-4-hydroxy-6-hydroxymethyldihydropteridine diphosphokinase [Planosporangium flavigriseum]|uniref:2-amino-4-hydroxy-6-hydroxymethyldihydropteridine diphosphokinase n=1 Tax=Planosporangium flavigriseum TaxID=373681 RepID=A0A8J3PKU7_9ACTN|nr:2-amino-4-hydroxy-6-hydroxymethyldihydropteridine diphosphokinase [Planosporangium flavigriseum]NJC63734.1 2-amino-4-hydroxy-6-hydroxymethyldihydropteridine diphosphokinase [Planosporangium flavigriseum]GIG73771.1 2-amino-4-hydroxy-6-hydroxymethyldihydropteridine diphosphokinase [Planosporangium flavigriseum]